MEKEEKEKRKKRKGGKEGGRLKEGGEREKDSMNEILFVFRTQFANVVPSLLESFPGRQTLTKDGIGLYFVDFKSFVLDFKL